MADTIRHSIEAAERRRCAAMLDNDAGALDAVLDPGLRFVPATGAVDDKSGFLAKMAAGRIAYSALEWSEDAVTALGPDCAMMTGRMTTRVRVDGAAKVLENRVITIWLRSAHDWRLGFFQSTPIKG